MIMSFKLKCQIRRKRKVGENMISPTIEISRWEWHHFLHMGFPSVNNRKFQQYRRV